MRWLWKGGCIWTKWKIVGGRCYCGMLPNHCRVDEKVTDRAKSFEGDSVAKWHGGVEVDGMMKKNMRDMYAEGGQGGMVCGLFV